MIAWEVATQRRPWQGMKKQLIVEKVINGERPTLYESDDWASDFKNLVGLCWHQEPLMRPGFKVIEKKLLKVTIPQ